MKTKVKPLYGKNSLPIVTTRDYIASMKAKSPAVLTETVAETTSAVVQEIAPVPGVGATISVRSAKAHLSALLELVAAGREVVITSDGAPKARLVPMAARPRQATGAPARRHASR